jgi:hypothetical protein
VAVQRPGDSLLRDTRYPPEREWTDRRSRVRRAVLRRDHTPGGRGGAGAVVPLAAGPVSLTESRATA